MSQGHNHPRLVGLTLAAALLVAAPAAYASPFLEALPHGILAKIESTWTPVLTWLTARLDKDGEPGETQGPGIAPTTPTGGDCTDDGPGADPNGHH